MSFGKLVLAIIVAWVAIQALPVVFGFGLALLARLLRVHW
jgi:hypothetical protein